MVGGNLEVTGRVRLIKHIDNSGERRNWFQALFTEIREKRFNHNGNYEMWELKFPYL